MISLVLSITNIEILLFLTFILILGFNFVLGNDASYLLPGIQDHKTIKANEIFFYYFFSYEEFDNFFSFSAISGKSMIYAHYNTESLPFIVNSKNLQKYYLSTGFFITPKVINDFLHLELKVTNANGFFWLPQWIVMVFCQEEEKTEEEKQREKETKIVAKLDSCEFSMAYSYAFLNVTLLENRTISAYTRENYNSEQYFFNAPNQSTITISYTVFSGNVDFTIIDNGNIIHPKTNIFSTKGEIQYYCKHNCSLEIVSSVFDPSYYSLYYLINKEDTKREQVKIGIVEIKDIRKGQNKTFFLEEYQATPSKMVAVYIKTENCILNVNSTGNRWQVIEARDNFYQLSFSSDVSMNKTEEFYVAFDKFDDDNDADNDRCVYYIYANKNDTIHSIVMIEGIELENKFIKKHPIINYEFPFIFNDEKNCLLLSFEVSNSNKMYVRIFFENYQYETIFDEINRNKTIFIPEEVYRRYCVPGRLCKILIQIISFLEDQSVKVQIKAKEKNINYIKQNKIITDKIKSGLSWYYYTNIKKGDKGIIQILNKFEKMNVTYKIIEKSVNKADIFNDDWIGESDYYSGILPYSADINCTQGCFLIIRVLYPSKSSNILSEFSFFVRNNNKSVVAPVNEKIKGFFESNTANYTFIFHLPLNTTAVRIVTKGENATYNFRSICKNNSDCQNSTEKGENTTYNLIICKNTSYCQNFTEEYTGETDTFLNNCTEKLEISARPPKLDVSLFFFYEIIVYPIISSDLDLKSSSLDLNNWNSDYPLHYIKSNSEIKCYTGEEHDKIFLIFDKIKNEPFDDILIYVDDVISNKSISKRVTILANPVDNTTYSRFLQEGHWSNHFLEKEGYTLKSNEGENFLKIKMNLNNSAFFITVQGERNNATMKVYLAKSIFSKTINLIPKENNFHYFHSHSSVKIYFLQKNFDVLKEDYICKIEIQEIFGRGIFIFDKPYMVQGNRVFTIESDYYLKKHYFRIKTSDEEYAVIIKYNFTKKEESSQFFLVNDASLFEFSSKIFPIDVFCLMTNVTDIAVNLRAVSENQNFSLSNLQITAKINITESESSKNKTDDIDLEEIQIKEKDMSILTLKLKEKPRPNTSLLKLFISSEEMNESNPITFQITGINRYSESLPILCLPQKKYIYDKMTSFGKDETYQLYTLNLGNRNQEKKKKVLFEFASCSQDTFSFDFKTDLSGTSIAFKETKEVGKISLNLLVDTMDQYLYLNLSFHSTNEKDIEHYYIMKYSAIDEDQNYPEFSNDKKIKNNYYFFNKTIVSQWGEIKNKTNEDSVVSSAVYYYYLYEKEEIEQNYFSICTLNSSITPRKTLGTSITLKSDSFSSSVYKTLVVGYFIDNNYEEYLISYELGEVSLSSSNIWVWIIIIVFVVLLLISFGTFRLFREISKREKEDTIPDSIEIKKKEDNSLNSLLPKEE